MTAMTLERRLQEAIGAFSGTAAVSAAHLGWWFAARVVRHRLAA